MEPLAGRAARARGKEAAALFGTTLRPAAAGPSAFAPAAGSADTTDWFASTDAKRSSSPGFFLFDVLVSADLREDVTVVASPGYTCEREGPWRASTCRADEIERSHEKRGHLTDTVEF